MKCIVINIINFYQTFISPMFGKHCRHIPSCSEYAKSSILKKGVCIGLIMSLLRIIKCNPFSKQAYYDPVK